MHKSRTAEAEPIAFSVPEAAKVSSLGQTSLYKAIKEKKLHAIKYGTRRIIRRIDLEAFLKSLPAS